MNIGLQHPICANTFWDTKSSNPVGSCTYVRMLPVIPWSTGTVLYELAEGMDVKLLNFFDFKISFAGFHWTLSVDGFTKLFNSDANAQQICPS